MAFLGSPIIDESLNRNSPVAAAWLCEFVVGDPPSTSPLRPIPFTPEGAVGTVQYSTVQYSPVTCGSFFPAKVAFHTQYCARQSWLESPCGPCRRNAALHYEAAVIRVNAYTLLFFVTRAEYLPCGKGQLIRYFAQRLLSIRRTSGWMSSPIQRTTPSSM